MALKPTRPITEVYKGQVLEEPTVDELYNAISQNLSRPSWDPIPVIVDGKEYLINTRKFGLD